MAACVALQLFEGDIVDYIQLHFTGYSWWLQEISMWAVASIGILAIIAMHPSIREVDAKIEMQCPVGGTNLMTGSQIDGSSLVFGPQAISQVANQRVSGQMALSLDDNGCFMMCVDTPGAVFTNITWDLWSALS